MRILALLLAAEVLGFQQRPHLCRSLRSIPSSDSQRGSLVLNTGGRPKSACVALSGAAVLGRDRDYLNAIRSYELLNATETSILVEQVRRGKALEEVRDAVLAENAFAAASAASRHASAVNNALAGQFGDGRADDFDMDEDDMSLFDDDELAEMGFSRHGKQHVKTENTFHNGGRPGSTRGGGGGHRRMHDASMTMTTSSGVEITMTVGNMGGEAANAADQKRWQWRPRQAPHSTSTPPGSSKRRGGERTPPAQTLTERGAPSSLSPLSSFSSSLGPSSPTTTSPLEVTVPLTQWAHAAGLESEEALVRQLRTAAAAKNTLVTANLRLVNLIVNRYAPLAKTMTHSDLMQEGSLGLVRAVEKYDPTLGASLAGYAVAWIRASITRAMEKKDSFVRLPGSQHEILSKLRLAMREVESEVELNSRHHPHLSHASSGGGSSSSSSSSSEKRLSSKEGGGNSRNTAQRSSQHHHPHVVSYGDQGEGQETDVDDTALLAAVAAATEFYQGSLAAVVGDRASRDGNGSGGGLETSRSSAAPTPAATPAAAAAAGDRRGVGGGGSTLMVRALAAKLGVSKDEVRKRLSLLASASHFAFPVSMEGGSTGSGGGGGSFGGSSGGGNSGGSSGGFNPGQQVAAVAAARGAAEWGGGSGGGGSGGARFGSEWRNGAERASEARELGKLMGEALGPAEVWALALRFGLDLDILDLEDKSALAMGTGSDAAVAAMTGGGAADWIAKTAAAATSTIVAATAGNAAVGKAQVAVSGGGGGSDSGVMELQGGTAASETASLPLFKVELKGVSHTSGVRSMREVGLLMGWGKDQARHRVAHALKKLKNAHAAATAAAAATNAAAARAGSVALENKDW